MTVRAPRFTPQVLLSAPRRSAGVPNPAGTRVLYTLSTYSFEKHSKSTELRVLDVATGDSHRLAQDDEISDVNWLDDDEIVYLYGEKDGTTSVYWSSVSASADEVDRASSRYVVGKIDGPAGNLKLARLGESHFAVVVSAEASPDGSLYNPEKAKKFHSTGRLYSSLYVRHWDRYETREKNSLWYGSLKKDDGAKYRLSDLTNALEDTPLESPVRPFGGADSFDVGPKGIIFVSKDPDLNPALNTKCNVYLLRIDSWEGDSARQKAQKVEIPDFEGASTCPVFSPDGKSAAFLSMEQAGYEADKNRIFLVSGLEQSTIQSTMVLSNGKSDTFWDRSPSSIAFSADGRSLLAIAEDKGYSRLFRFSPRPGSETQPSALTSQGYVSDFRPMKDGRAFVSGSSLIDNSFFAIVDASGSSSETPQSGVWISSNSDHGNKFGLNESQVSSIWTPASNPKVNKEVHSWVMRPSSFDKSKKYPVAYLIHGGPQGSWGDNWSTRWNPAVFAEQGYIVVSPNPTGSTGYGQAFTDAIRRNWGGDPYEDIVKAFEWVGEHMPEADNERAVALGASYGGYMVNWVQGHDFGRKFKAMVCHDGIFSLSNLLSTEELYFPFYDLGGAPFHDAGPKFSSSSALAEASSNFGLVSLDDWRKWDPAQHLDNWSTPQLVIHNSKDYRLCVSEGLAAFNVLQTRGVDSQYLTFPDENHWVLKPENSLVWHKVVLNWINKYVGLPPFAPEDPEGEELFGGVAENNEEPVMVPGQGKPET